MQLFTCANKLRPLKNPGVVSFAVVLFICIFWGIFSAAFVPPDMRVLVGVVISAALFTMYCLFMGKLYTITHINLQNRCCLGRQTHLVT